MSAWRFIAAFGVISLLADLVYEGARAVTGPYLATLGASAAVVGVVTGAGEAFALAGRLGSGPLADRTRAYWPLTIAGYALTVAAVPLLGVTGVLWAACLLVVAERAGKAIRSPAKDVMLSHAAAAVGRGRGFAVHEALDQIGAVAGPLLVAGVLVLAGGDYRPALWMLAVPGAAVLVLLVRLRTRVPNPAHYEPTDPAPTTPEPLGDPARNAPPVPEDAAPTAPELPDGLVSDGPVREGPARFTFVAGSAVGRSALGGAARPRAAGTSAPPLRLPGAFWSYVGFTVLSTAGFATFGVLSFHLATSRLLSPPAIPVLYAAAMAVDAVAALVTGWVYDRAGTRVLFAVPVLSAFIPALAFAGSLGAAVTGVLLWGAVLGVGESTMRAAVADLVPVARRGTAYGVFAAGYGAAALVGGLLTGALHQHALPALIIIVAVLQALALLLLAVTRRHTLKSVP